MNAQEHSAKLGDFFITRRQFLQRAGMGFGALSLSALLAKNFFESPASAVESIATITPRQPHFPAKAKHVVHIFAQGAPSHVDTWDPKPRLKNTTARKFPAAVAAWRRRRHPPASAAHAVGRIRPRALAGERDDLCELAGRAQSWL